MKKAVSAVPARKAPLSGCRMSHSRLSARLRAMDLYVRP
jgi:hypothetical protein